MFEQVIEASEDAFNRSPHSHLILPAFTDRLQGDGVDVIWNEAAVRSWSMTQTLANHASEHCLKSFFVTVIMLPHPLQTCTHTHLTTGDWYRGIKQIKVG